MARFDIYANPDRSEHRHTPFVLDIQSNHIAGLETRVVVPLRDARHFPPALDGVQPVFDVQGRSVVLDTPTMATFPRQWLRKPVTSLGAERAAVQDALDILFGAY